MATRIRRDPDDPTSLTGRVTATIAPDTVGEVMLPIRGGIEAYYAHPAQGETIPLNTQVIVVEHLGGRTVSVSPLSDLISPDPQS